MFASQAMGRPHKIRVHPAHPRETSYCLNLRIPQTLTLCQPSTGSERQGNILGIGWPFFAFQEEQGTSKLIQTLCFSPPPANGQRFRWQCRSITAAGAGH